jgi:uncharacterized membrane protein
MKYVFFIIALVLQPTSQLLEKRGILQLGKISSFGQLLNLDTLTKLIHNPYIIAGVALSVILLLFWLAALSSWDMSILYPLSISLTQIIMVAAAVIFFGESMTLGKGLGVVVIALGCILLNLK